MQEVESDVNDTNETDGGTTHVEDGVVVEHQDAEEDVDCGCQHSDHCKYGARPFPLVFSARMVWRW